MKNISMILTLLPAVLFSGCFLILVHAEGPPGGYIAVNGGYPAHVDEVGKSGPNAAEELAQRSSSKTRSTDDKSISALKCEATGSLQITCPDKLEIEITPGSVLYGRDDMNTTCPHPTCIPVDDCSSPTAESVVTNLCNGKRSCDIRSRNDLFGDPCPGSYKYLRLDYTCKEKSSSVLMCEATGKMRITCPDNQEIEVTSGSVLYGRGDMNTTCPHPTTVPIEDCSSPIAETIVTKLCNGKRWCDIDPRNYIFGDPCPGSYKYLQFDYTCKACVNIFGDDAQCEAYAMMGYCSNAYSWEMINCRKACLKCSDQMTECRNDYGNDADCESWAGWGECTRNPIMMLSGCKAACTGCNLAGKRECSNYLVSDACCENWYWNGKVMSDPQLMLDYCWKTTTGCAPYTEPTDCVNAGMADTTCDFKAANGDCRALDTIDDMFTKCYKSCSYCGFESEKLLYIGNLPKPSDTSTATANKIVILPNAFPVEAKLTHFIVFFGNQNQVTLQILRPKKSDFTKVYETTVVPNKANIAQTIDVPECVMVKAGDRLAFADDTGAPSIAATVLDIEDPLGQVVMRDPNGPLEDMNVILRFSYAGAYSLTEPC